MSGANHPSPEEMLYAAFERTWKKMHPGQSMPRRIWLKRSPDGIWGDPGYEQPVTHFDWMYFKAGVEWAQKMMASGLRKKNSGRSSAVPRGRSRRKTLKLSRTP